MLRDSSNAVTQPFGSRTSRHDIIKLSSFPFVSNTRVMIAGKVSTCHSLNTRHLHQSHAEYFHSYLDIKAFSASTSALLIRVHERELGADCRLLIIHNCANDVKHSLRLDGDTNSFIFHFFIPGMRL